MSYETIDPSKAQLAFQIQDRSVNEFHVVRYTGTEGFCQLFRFEIDLSSNVGTAKLEELVGEAAVLSINTPWGARWFHGIIGRFQLTGDSGDHTYYRAELVPSLWRLTHRYKSRIFQLEGKSTKDIVLKVLQDGGVPSDRVDAGNFKGTRKKRPYCVQYRETDYQFICRLLEDEGARWYFEHDQDGHTLVLCDETSAYQPIDGEPGKLPYQPPSGMYAEEEHVTHFKIAHSMRPDAVVLTDYDFEHPDLALKAESSKGTKKQHVFADSPGQFKTADLGGKLAQLRIDELNAGSTAAAGQSNSPRLTVGHTFEISNHPTEDANKTYLLTSLTHNGTQGSVGPTDASTTKAYGADLSVIRRAAQWLYNGGHVSTDAAAAANLFGENPLNAITAPDLLGTNGSQPENGAGAALYACRFECIPATAAYRPPRVTPWPKIAGAQTARVVGPDKETIHTDKYGRVKVQFHWDREGNEAGKPKQHGADSSCWIRVSQGMAGGNYGMMFLPRVGQEVIVEFIEGNPDEPIITGRVYNFDHMPPYELPANATRSTIKTSSVPDAKGTNEICFEDMAGKEYLLIHAQKDLHVRVKEKRIETVVKDRQLTVEGNKHEHVKQAKHVEVGLDLFEKVGGKKELKVAGDVAEDFGANHTEVTQGRRTPRKQERHALSQGLQGHCVGGRRQLSQDRLRGNRRRRQDGRSQLRQAKRRTGESGCRRGQVGSSRRRVGNG